MTELTEALREREYRWTDPAALAELAAGRDGLSAMRAVCTGELPTPPIMQTLGLRLLEVEAGSVVFELRPAEFHYNALGGVHGGVFATVLDSAAGCAVHSRLPAGVGYTTLDLTTKFLRGITVATGPLRCTGTVVYLGRRTGLAEAQLRGPDDRLYAHATSSVLIFQP